MNVFKTDAPIEFNGTKMVAVPKPDGLLLPRMHKELTMAEVGRVHLDFYEAFAPSRLVCRALSLQHGSVQWYLVTLI